MKELIIGDHIVKSSARAMKNVLFWAASPLLSKLSVSAWLYIKINSLSPMEVRAKAA